MGFLGVNTKRRSPFTKAPAKRAKSASPAPSVRQVTPEIVVLERIARGRRLAPIEMLSGDVLGLILAYSGNVDLPQASPVLAHKLRRSRYLELALVRAQVHRHRLPVLPALRWPFVDAALLDELEVFHFTAESARPPFVPASLEANLDDPRNVELIAYMVRRGCYVENSRRVYKALALHHHWLAVSAMAARNHRADADVVVMALRGNQGAELAIQLLKLSHGVQTDWNQLWAVQQAALDASVPEVNAYVNTG